MNYKVSNLTNSNIEIGGVFWLAGQSKDLLFLSDAVREAETEGLVSITNTSGATEIEVAGDAVAAISVNLAVEAPFNTINNQ